MQTTFKNQPLIIDPSVTAIDQGWAISGNVASHSGCYPGKLYSTSISLKPGITYVAEYEISSFTSGIVYISLGGIAGTSNNTVGSFTQEFIIPEDSTNDKVFFYSDGVLSVKFTSIYPKLVIKDNAVTLGFNVKENKWTTDHYSFAPEMMLRFTNNFYTFKNGGLWKHNVNPLHSNFYGTQYNSYIDVLCNVEYAKNKGWYNLRLDSKGKWYAPQITVPATDKFPNGMRSRIKKNNFKLINNTLWADILKDMNDPSFLSITDVVERENKAVMNGRDLEGFCVLIRLVCDDTTEAKLASMTVYYTEKERNF